MAGRAGENQKLKMLYLVKIFEEETDDLHALTMPEIRDRLAAHGVNADRKTLYEDIRLLKEYGFDIISEKEGRDYLYHLGSRRFELPELKLLVDAVQSSRFITDRKSKELIGKLESLASRYEGSRLHRQVLIAGRVKTMNESIYYNVDKIHEAIGSNRQISFRYFDWNVKKEMVPRRDGKLYILSPWVLVWDDEKYYLVAYDADADMIKHYRVDKMQEIRITEESRLGRENFKDFDLAAFARKTFGMYGGEDRKITLEGENNLVGVVIDRFGTDVMIHPHDQEHFHAGVTVTVSPQFFGWLAGIGKGIRISWPEDVREAYKQYLQGIVDCL